MNLIAFAETYTERCPKCLGTQGWKIQHIRYFGTSEPGDRERLDLSCMRCDYTVSMACADAGEKA